MAPDTPSFAFQLVNLVVFAMIVGAPAPLVLHVLAAESLRSRWSPSHTVLVGLILWVLLQSCVVVTLGWTSHLWLRDVLLLESILALCGLRLLSAHRARLVAFRRELRTAFSRIFDRSPFERWLFALIATTAALMAVESIAVPTPEYDSIAYQLPRVVEWYQRGTFLGPWLQFAGGMIDAYPYSWNTLFLLGLMALKHDQFILFLNITSWAILGLAVYGLGAVTASRTATAFLASALVLLMPLSVYSVHTAHNDLPFSAFLLSSVYFSIHAHRHRQPLSVVMAVACAGMMLGTKMTGVACLGLLVVLWTWLQVWGRTMRPSGLLTTLISGSPVVAIAAVASVTLLGASWYLRNALVLGNPLGYVRVALFGHVVWDGYITQEFVNRTNLLHNFRLIDPQHWAIVWHALRDGPGLPGTGLLIAACLSLPRALRRQGQDRVLLLTVTGLCLATLYLFVAGPWSAKQPDDPDLSTWMGWQLRYTFHVWGLLAALVAASVTAAPLPLRWAGGVLATIGMMDAVRWEASTIGIRHRGLAITSAACVAVLLFLSSTRPACRLATRLSSRFWRWRQQSPMMFRSGIAVAGIVAILASTGATVVAMKLRHRALDRMWGGISRFIDEDLGTNTRLGFWGSHRSYLLYGRRFDRRLFYLPLDAAETPNRMKRLLREAQIDFLAVGPAIQPSPVWEWLASDVETFQPVYGRTVHDDVVVYHVARTTP